MACNGATKDERRKIFQNIQKYENMWQNYYVWTDVLKSSKRMVDENGGWDVGDVDCRL